jgi:hypothetical protein
MEDELLVNPYIDAHLGEREAKSTTVRKPCLGHYEVVQVPRRFYVQLRACNLVVLAIPPIIAWEVSRVLKVTAQAGATIPLHHGEFCEYRIHM